MKLLTTFLFIFLASSTYRCRDPEETIDCASAAKEMIGTWKGRVDYTSSSAYGETHNITMSVISSNECFFQAINAFDEATTTFVVSGTIDKYGWVEFMETEYEIDGGEYTGCTGNGSNWNNPCNRWPYVRWRPGTKFHEARFRSDPYVLQGEFFTQGGGWNSTVRGNFTISKQ